MKKNVLGETACRMAFNAAIKTVGSGGIKSSLKSLILFHQPKVPEKLVQKYRK